MSATAFQRHRRERAKKREIINLEPKNLDELSAEELKAYAAQNGIDIGKSTSVDGILKKIKAAQDDSEADGEE